MNTKIFPGTCKTCVYTEVLKGRGTYLICHRFPPTYSEDEGCNFPSMEYDDYCAEYKKMEQE